MEVLGHCDYTDSVEVVKPHIQSAKRNLIPSVARADNVLHFAEHE